MDMIVFVTSVVMAAGWFQVAPGLELQELDAPVKSLVGDSKIRMARIDVDRCEVALKSGPAVTAPKWAEQGFHVVINAGMFHADGTPVGYAQSEGRLLNGQWRNNKT